MKLVNVIQWVRVVIAQVPSNWEHPQFMTTACGTFLDILTSRIIYFIRDICHADQE